MQFKVNIPYPVSAKDFEGGVIPSNQLLTSNYINTAVSTKYRQGLDGQWRRLWGRIQQKLDGAVDGNTENIDLDRSELEFIKRGFGDDVSLPAGASKCLVYLEDEIDRALKGETPNETPEGKK